jgi:hypothetical protein
LDEPVEPASGGRYGPDIEPRLSRVELDVRDLKDTQADLKSIVARIEAKLDAVLPYLATKADLTNMQAKLDATLPHLATKADPARPTCGAFSPPCSQPTRAGSPRSPC